MTGRITIGIAHDAFNQHLQTQFGIGSSLEDYERKAQMMNYVDYRAIFEGFNAHLWAPNGGRLLWMTQPAWPSTLWGILSSDYDTQASYYGTKKACEPCMFSSIFPTTTSLWSTPREIVSTAKSHRRRLRPRQQAAPAQRIISGRARR